MPYNNFTRGYDLDQQIRESVRQGIIIGGGITLLLLVVFVIGIYVGLSL